jgi:protein-tyrosine-phosphatase
MADKTYNVLFLSRRNSTRSVMAEAVLNKEGRGRFHAHSAAVQPATAPEPFTIEMLKQAKFPTDGLRTKHYREFTAPGAPLLDFVFTLSDTAAGKVLPEWPGRPVTAHWSRRDPVLVAGEEWERRQAFGAVLSELERRLRIFVNLPIASLDRISLQSRVSEIGSD